MLLATFNAIAQTSFIKQAKTFYYIRIPGNIPVDEKHNLIQKPHDTVTTVYFEVKGKLLQWKKAWHKGKLFSISLYELTGSNIVIGKRLEADEVIFIKIAKGNKITALELHSGQAEVTPKKNKQW